jgi:hypothetical protein
VDARSLAKVFMGRETYSSSLSEQDISLNGTDIKYITAVLADGRKKDRDKWEAYVKYISSEAAIASRKQQLDGTSRQRTERGSPREMEELRQSVAVLQGKLDTERTKHRSEIKSVKEKATEAEKTVRRESERALRAYMKSAVHALQRMDKKG